jgi:glycosyltransferase involved in cell wall biosynthesis
MNSLATIIIAARDAAATIERAVRSATVQGDCKILLVDDFSSDDTVARAQGCAGGRLQVVSPASHQTLGVARQTGLAAIETEYGIWLDADDELLPGRVEHMVASLEGEGADLTSDEVELYDGPTGRYREILHIPPFLKGHHPLARLFERNYLPGIGVIGFRTDFALRIGYDTLLHGAEDMDFVLRAVAAGGQFCLLVSPGYRQYAYPSSISRNVENQRRMYRSALRKHQYQAVEKLLRSAGYDDRITAWALASMAIFREDYAQALSFVAALEAMHHDPEEVIEPQGPCPRPEGWLISFYRGTLFLLMNQAAEAIFALEDAQRILPTAEGANNLGAARMASEDTAGAQMHFEESLALYPEYRNAQHNLSGRAPVLVATHPLRCASARRDYAPSAVARV